MSSIFGAAPSGSSLFGSNNTTTTSVPTGQSLFSNLTTTAPTGTSLFGNTNAPSTLFGAQNQQSTGAGTASLFAPQTQPQPSLFGPQPQIQSSGPAATTFSGFSPLTHASHFPPHLSLPQQQDLARTRLHQAGLSTTNRSDEKTVWDQAQTLVRKWDPNSQDALMQTYLYNAVSAAYAPFYYKKPEEDERGWEEALAAAPKVGAGEEGLRFVPVLVRGFWDLGQRVEYQAHTVKAMQERLHEMQNSLDAVMAAHAQRISVQIEGARRQHAALAQRTLRLGVKLQVLRNRGYALDGTEEGLRKQLVTLSTRVTDPAFAAREEEIWARMVALRERARWLEEEGKRLGSQVNAQEQEQGQAGGGQTSALPEEVIETTRKILRDYDGQLRHLAKELGEVGREYADWEGGQQGVGGGARRQTLLG